MYTGFTDRHNIGFLRVVYINIDIHYVYYNMAFSISALVSSQDSHIRPDSEAGGLIWVECWYQRLYEKFHVIIYLSHILYWLFPSMDFYIADKIFELINCKNKSLRELPLFNLQILLFWVWFQKDIKQCRSVQWLENVCKIYRSLWHLNGNSYSTRWIHVSQLFRFKLFWNMLIWLKYDFTHIFIHHLS